VAPGGCGGSVGDGGSWRCEVMRWVVVVRCCFADVFGFGVGGAGLRWWFG
jgi:hypothetical protein